MEAQFWGVLGEMNPLEVFGRVRTPKRHIEPFFLGAEPRKEQNKKITQSLYVDPLWLGPFDRLMKFRT